MRLLLKLVTQMKLHCRATDGIVAQTDVARRDCKSRLKPEAGSSSLKSGATVPSAIIREAVLAIIFFPACIGRLLYKIYTIRAETFPNSQDSRYNQNTVNAE